MIPLVYHPQGGWQYADMHQGVNGFKIIMNKSDFYYYPDEVNNKHHTR